MDLWFLWTPNHHPFSWHINTSLELSAGYGKQSTAALGFEPTAFGVWGQRSTSYATADCNYAALISNITIIQRYQSKILHMITQAPWYILNDLIHKAFNDEVENIFWNYKLKVFPTIQISLCPAYWATQSAYLSGGLSKILIEFYVLSRIKFL